MRRATLTTRFSGIISVMAWCSSFLVALLLPVVLHAQAPPPPTDRDDAIALLQGTTTDGRIPPEEIARIESWLQRLRAAHPALAGIHRSPTHEPGAAVLFFDPTGQQQVAKAKFAIEAGRLMQQGPLDIPALDALQQELGARLHRYGIPGAAEIWIARFPKELDVIAVCRRYQELAAVETAEPNGYGSFGFAHDDIVLHVRGDLLLFTFVKGGPGEVSPGWYRYYEVDAKNGTITPRGELRTKARLPLRVHRWNVPERFPVGPFADLDAVLTACRSDEWWVARHGTEVIGHLLLGAERPLYGEDFEQIERFRTVREQLLARRREVCDVLLGALGHEDPAVRGAALRWLRHHSKLEHGADGEGRAAFARWIEELLR